jgi:hypothetical protein
MSIDVERSALSITIFYAPVWQKRDAKASSWLLVLD